MPHQTADLQSSPGTRTGGLQLRILQGQTRFPCRPLRSERFLIGAGSQCHLQLGGPFPLVHSVIHVAGLRSRIESLVPEPVLKVNGVECQSAELPIGAIIEMGPFRFELGLAGHATQGVSAHQEESGTAIGPTSDVAPSEPVPGADELASAPEDFSARELVDRLEIALSRLETIESRQREGWQALLASVLKTGEMTAAATPHAGESQPTDTPPQRRSA